MIEPKPGPLGTHAYYGAYAPDKVFMNRNHTFSVACFEWIPRSNREGTKRGPAKVRVKGFMNDPDVVFDCAAKVCEQLDAGTYKGAKTINCGI
jgi:hypothetical protein